jgi:hypothetical protein
VVINSRRIRWAEHTAGLSEISYTEFQSEDLKEMDHVEDRDVDGEIILKWIVKKVGVMVWFIFVWLNMGPTVINIK